MKSLNAKLINENPDLVLTKYVEINPKIFSIFKQRVFLKVNHNNQFIGLSSIRERPVFFNAHNRPNDSFLVIDLPKGSSLRSGDLIDVEFVKEGIKGRFYSRVILVNDELVKIVFPTALYWSDRREHRRVNTKGSDVTIKLKARDDLPPVTAIIHDISLSGLSFLFDEHDDEMLGETIEIGDIEDVEISHKDKSKKIEKIKVVRRDSREGKVLFGAHIEGGHKAASVESFLQNVINKTELESVNNHSKKLKSTTKND
jgi:c-di-GMP-binding flagellar brake protein YcgR